MVLLTSLRLRKPYKVPLLNCIHKAFVFLLDDHNSMIFILSKPPSKSLAYRT